MKKLAIKVLASAVAAVIPLALAASPARADSYSVNLGGGGYNYPYHTYSPPVQYPPPIQTGGSQLFAMFNPATGFLTQVDMSFYYTTGYGGTLSNMTSYSVPDAWFVDTGSKTAWYNFTPVGTLWSHNANGSFRSHCSVHRSPL